MTPSPITEITAPSKSTDQDEEISVGSSTDEGARSPSDTRSNASSRSGFDDADNVYFAQNESRRVFRLRVAVFSLLFLVATGVCTGVYLVVRNGQQDEFEAA